MSVAQFSPVLRDKIIEIYSDGSDKVDLANFGKKTRKQFFKEAPDTKTLRKRFEAKDFHTSSLTLEGMSALTSRIIDTLEDKTTKEIVKTFFNSPNFFSDFVTTLETENSLSDYGSGDYRLENVRQDTLKDAFVAYISTKIPGLSKDTIANIKENIQSGHLAGVFFLKLKTALGVKADFSKESDATYRDFTISMAGLQNDSHEVKTLDSVLKAVLDADFLTSNLITQSQIFIDATKSVLGDNPQLITELQFTADNKAAGDLLQQTGKQLNLLIQAASKREQGPADEAIKKLIVSLKPVVDVIFQKVEQLKEPLSTQGLYEPILKNAEYLLKTLINTSGSATFVEGIAQNLGNIIKTGKSLQSVKTVIKPKPIVTKHKEIVDISRVAKDFKAAATAIKASIKKQKISKTLAVKPTKSLQTSLVSLQNLINANLAEKIKENMGDGNARNVLNLRSGRLAESAQVERMSQSRAGMITAFYSYMKNPYATFSAGGRQQDPKSRDPKLLISKSIREIAAQQVGNRLRSVLV